MKRQPVYIFDKEDTLDRFTIILKDGTMYAASSNPFHPQGIGMFTGEVVQCRIDEWQHLYDHEKGKWAAGVVAHHLNEYVKEARSNPEWIGKEVRLEEVPEEVQKYVQQLLMPEVKK